MKKWIIKNTNKHETKLHSNDFLNRLLLTRGIENSKDVDLFLNPLMDKLHDPFLLKDMDRAIERIDEVIKKGQKIVIYGDYDVDGITSTSMLFRAFNKLGMDVSYYIPDRLDEGYGLNLKAIKYLESLQTDLIITVDCGISSIEEVEVIKSSGMDVIITDHHECRDVLPNTIVINPKRSDCTYPCKSLAGCGVAFKLIQALWNYYDIDGVEDFLDIAAIGTVADIVDIREENRIIVKNGIEKINKTDKCGIIALKAIAGLKEDIKSSAIAFQLAPRINAIGRLRDAKIAVELFTTADYDKAIQIAKYLDQENKRRQKIEEKIINEAIEKINNELDLKNDRVIVVSSSNWHVGVIGIVASKLVDIYNRPTIILNEEMGIAKGSGRSIEGFNLFEALLDTSGILETFGGHEMAAGLKLNIDNIETLRKKLNLYAKNMEIDSFIKSINVDMVLDKNDVTFENLESMKELEPFGEGNPTPVFGMEDMLLVSKKYVGTGEKHIKLKFTKGEVYYDGILFNYGKNYMEKDWKSVDIAFNMDENNWMGKKSIQFIVKDIKPYKKWIKESLKDNYYKYLKNVQTDINEYFSLDNIRFIEENLGFLKEFLCFGKGHILISSKESLNELDELFDTFGFSGNIAENEDYGIIICPKTDLIDFNKDILVYDFLPSGYDYNNLLRKTKGGIYHFYSENIISKANSYLEDLSVNEELVTNFMEILKSDEINGTLSYISKMFNVNPYKLYSLMIYLRKEGIIEIFSKNELIKIKLKNEFTDISIKDINKQNLSNMKLVKDKLEELSIYKKASIF